VAKTKKPKPAPPEAPPPVQAPAPPWPPAPFPVDAAVAELKVRANYAGLDFDPANNPDDAALVESVRTHGVLQNLLVRPVSKKGWEAHVSDDGASVVGLDHFEVVAGHRRLAAAKAAGLERVPAECRWLKDDEVVAIQLVENDQRRQPKVSRQVAGYADLAGKGWTLERIAATTGKPVAFVRSVLALAKLPAWALAAVDTGALPRATAELVARVPGEVSRGRAAACVLWGQTDPARLLPVQVETLEQLGKKFAADYRYTDEPPLSYRDTKDLIRTHFQRQLKGAPFSLKVLYERPAGEDGRVSQIESCDACPKRAGNDPEAKAEGVRQDTCLDPDCFGLKVEAYRELERAKFRKRFKLDADAEVNPDGAVMNDRGNWDMAGKGWCEWTKPVNTSELNDGNGFGSKYVGKTVADVVLACPVVKGCRPNLVFDAKDKPRILVKTSEALRTLRDAGILKKPEPRKPAEKPKPSPLLASKSDPKGPSDYDVSGRAAEIAGKVIQEYTADALDGELVDLAPTLKPALELVARFLVWDHVKFGAERLALVNATLGGDKSTRAGVAVGLDDLAAMSAGELLAAALRLAAVPVLLDQQPAEGSFGADLLGYAELDWPNLTDQARRELAGGETADAKIDRAEAAVESAPDPTPLKTVHGIPDAAIDLLEAEYGDGVIHLETVLGACEAATAGLGALPLRNRLVTYFVKLGAKIKPAEQAAKAISDHVEGKAVGK